MTRLKGAALDRAVANAMGFKSVHNCEQWGKPMTEDEALKQAFDALAQPVQEPDLTAAYMSGLHDGKKKRPWVGLTDDELAALSASGLALWSLWRAIEQALKEKNNG